MLWSAAWVVNASCLRLVPPCTQAFASPQRLAEMVAKVRAALGTALPEAVAKMKLYLNNPATHAVSVLCLRAGNHGRVGATAGASIILTSSFCEYHESQQARK